MKNRIGTFSAGLLIVSSLVVALAGVALGNVQTFKITGSQNLATVQSDTSVENFVGRTNKVTGELRFDPAAKTGGGVIIVEGSSIQTGNTVRDGHMRSAQWMNFDKHPQVRFETTSVKHETGDQYQVTGKLSMSGATRDVTATATLRFLPASDSTRQLGFQGDVVNLRTSFMVKLSDFSVKIPAQATATVADAQRVQINVFASNK
jgi:polyisoprenoid-binding protein YceI